MSHYSSLATVLMRIIGVLLVLIGLAGAVYGLLAGLFLSSPSPEAAVLGARLISAAVFLTLGFVVYSASKPIGKLVGKGLHSSEQS